MFLHTGGHTTEILRLLSAMSESYSPRCYVIANTDKMSEDKIKTFEAERKELSKNSQVRCNKELGGWGYHLIWNGSQICRGS